MREPKGPAEQSARSIVAAFFVEFIPGVKNDYELLAEASESPLKIGLPEIQMETLIFGLHCLDRAVFARYGTEYRDAFMDSALAAASRAFCEVLPDSARDRFLERFAFHYRTRQTEYASMRTIPDENGILAGMLTWEYARRICHDAGVENPLAVQVIFENAVELLSMMNRISETL